jgi:phage portal protein BeeE
VDIRGSHAVAVNWRALLPRRRRRSAPRQAWFEQVERAAGYGIDDYFSFNNVGYSGTPGQVAPRSQERMEGDFAGLVRDGLKANSIIWSCERLRVKVFSQARFMYQHLNDGRPGDLHDSPATRLQVLEHPWRNATTGDLLARMRLHSDLGGNSYVVSRYGGLGASRLRVLRPDWVSIVMGSDEEPGRPQRRRRADHRLPLLARRLVESARTRHVPGRRGVPLRADARPHAHYRGMSWLNPVIAELETDKAATEHTLQFFRNGATTQVIVTVDKDIDETRSSGFMKQVQRRDQAAWPTHTRPST